MATLTISESILKPGIGFVPFSRETQDYPVQDEAQAAFDFYRSYWGEAEVVEQDGSTVELQVSTSRRVLIDLS